MNTNGACMRVEPGAASSAEAQQAYGHPGNMLWTWCGESAQTMSENPASYAASNTASCAEREEEEEAPRGYDSDGNPCPEPQEGVPHPPGCSGSPILLPLGNSQAFKLTNAARREPEAVPVHLDTQSREVVFALVIGILGHDQTQRKGASRQLIRSGVGLKRAVDRESIVVFGCSGGGDLALEVGTRTKICVVVPEEPASVVNGGLHA